MTPPSSRNSVRGFTLIELLVVICIIAILAGLLFPELSGMMSHARKAKCAANLRNIGGAMITFATDNNGNFPLSGGEIYYNTTGSGTPGVTLGWTQQLEPYLGVGSAKENSSGSGIFQCPDRALVSENIYYSYFNGAHAGNSGTSTSVVFGAVNLMKMHAPSAHIIAGDIGWKAFTSLDAKPNDDADKDDYGGNNPPFGGAILIHGGTVNLVFADGHVENAKSYDNTKMTTHYAGLITSGTGSLYTDTP